jgi:trehalose 6-phosphate synthase
MKEEFSFLNYCSEEEITSQHQQKFIEKDLLHSDKIIFASLYLPVRVFKDANNKWDLRVTNEPFYNTIWNLSKERNITWIGLLRNYNDIDEDSKESIQMLLQKKYNMQIIKLDRVRLNNLIRFITEVLEPHFHYVSILHTFEQIKEFENLWNIFKEFNESVAKAIVAIYDINSLVFLHDFHLLLTPSLIYNTFQGYYNSNKNFKNISIGLFIHSPFPAHDLFRRFPYRDEILKSMLNCSIIGFHTFDSSRNFLTSCKRLLLINYESNINGDLAVSYFGRNVIIRVKHVSSEIDLIRKEIQKKEFLNFSKELKIKVEGKYVFVSVDNLMFLAGVRHKLEGYRRFLRDLGENYYKQNVLIQYIVQDDSIVSNEDRNKIDDLKLNIMELSRKIKNEFGEDVLEIIEKKINYSERLAIFAIGNCYVRTCRRESFSLDIYEFLNLKILFNELNDVSYILSGLSGVTTSLSGAIKVNPFEVIFYLSILFDFI